MSARQAAGLVDGKHFTAYVDEVKGLKRSGDNDAAAGLLLRLVGAVEAEAKAAAPGWYIAPWYFEQLALLYRKTRRSTLRRPSCGATSARAQLPGMSLWPALPSGW
ncbi:hypothetical protein [uncultured Azohydromonas sp.]|uniref:hypothetical protein n=1 Tax=uncultured Azohydromonas sp. TaxID=487342 RepID=UPI0026304749|nr:hypothetical protein [uncultured Azohydromonas sp.]